MIHRRHARNAVLAAGVALVVSAGTAAMTGQAAADTTPPEWRIPLGVQAELPNAQHGIVNEPTTDERGGQNAAYIADGDWLQFNIRFHPRELPWRTINSRIASGAGAGVTGTIEVRVDALDAPPVATIPVGDTGGWQSWQTTNTPLDQSLYGERKVFVTFSSPGAADFVNVNWFSFS